jgi:hypothetical protein
MFNIFSITASRYKLTIVNIEFRKKTPASALSGAVSKGMRVFGAAFILSSVMETGT